MKIFLDDLRMPYECAKYMHTRIGPFNQLYLEQWVIVKNFEQFVKLFEKLDLDNQLEQVTHISFDHDLADFHYGMTGSIEKTGYDCAKWLKDFYQNKNLPLPTLFIHSMNPIGTQNIVNLFKPKEGITIKLKQ